MASLLHSAIVTNWYKKIGHFPLGGKCIKRVVVKQQHIEHKTLCNTYKHKTHKKVILSTKGIFKISTTFFTIFANESFPDISGLPMCDSEIFYIF